MCDGHVYRLTGFPGHELREHHSVASCKNTGEIRALGSCEHNQDSFARKAMEAGRSQYHADHDRIPRTPVMMRQRHEHAILPMALHKPNAGAEARDQFQFLHHNLKCPD
jgi:hypothetical protein